MRLVIKGIIRYAKTTEEEVNRLIEEKNFVMPKNYDQAVYYIHKTQFHWAMLTVQRSKFYAKELEALGETKGSGKKLKLKKFPNGESVEDMRKK